MSFETPKYNDQFRVQDLFRDVRDSLSDLRVYNHDKDIENPIRDIKRRFEAFELELATFINKYRDEEAAFITEWINNSNILHEECIKKERVVIQKVQHFAEEAVVQGLLSRDAMPQLGCPIISQFLRCNWFI